MTHPIQFLLTPLAHLTSAVLGYSWLLQQNPSIDWATHKITFQTKTSISPIAAPHVTIPGAHSQLSDLLSCSAPLMDISSPSLELQAAATKVTIPFVRATLSTPSSVICSGFIKYPSCSTQSAVPLPDSSEVEPLNMTTLINHS